MFIKLLRNNRGEVDGDGKEIVVPIDNKVEPPAYTPPELNMAEALPPEFRDKEYFKDKTFVDVIKDHANLQTLLGQRPAGVPKEDASDEEWMNFHSSLKPKSADEYTFPETEFSKAQKRSPEYEKAVRDIMIDANIPKRSFPKVIEGIEKFLGEAQGAQTTATAEQAKAREEEFEGLLDKHYPQDKQAVIDRTKKLMTDSIDPSMKEQAEGVLKDISNETLFALTAVLDGVYKKYVAEDGPPGGDDNAGGDVASWQVEAEKIMGSKEYGDFRMAGHDDARQKVQELFQKIATAGKTNQK